MGSAMTEGVAGETGMQFVPDGFGESAYKVDLTLVISTLPAQGLKRSMVPFVENFRKDIVTVLVFGVADGKGRQ